MKTNLTEPMEAFIDMWTTDPNQAKPMFLALREHLASLDGIRFEFVPRPGITYSLRAAHADQTKRSLYAMVDVIDDDPAERWLSVCFYHELVDDPEKLGDEVPEGLLGEDAKCFDIYEADEKLLAYIKERLGAAHQAASQEA